MGSYQFFLAIPFKLEFRVLEVILIILTLFLKDRLSGPVGDVRPAIRVKIVLP